MPYSTPIASDTIPGRIRRPVVGRYFGDTARASIALDAVAECHHSGDLDQLVDCLKELVSVIDLWPEDVDAPAILDEVWEHQEAAVIDWIRAMDLEDQIGSQRQIYLKSNFSFTLPQEEPDCIPGTILTGQVGDWSIHGPGAVVLLQRNDPLAGIIQVWCRLIPGTQISQAASDAEIPTIVI